MRIVPLDDYDNLPLLEVERDPETLSRIGRMPPTFRDCPDDADYIRCWYVKDVIRVGHNAVFGLRMKFAGGSRFGDAVIFGRECSFRSGCVFGARCFFGPRSTFGFCIFGPDCVFGEKCIVPKDAPEREIPTSWQVR